MDKTEDWKDIPNYEKKYQCSNLGRIKSLERRVRVAKGFRTVKEKILKQSLNNRGYLNVTLWDIKQKTHQIHVLVAICFLNHKPCGHDLIVDHIDFNRENNKISNLRIITQRENTKKTHLKSSSNYRGVCWHKGVGKWVSHIFKDGKLNYLGAFSNELDASNAYKNELSKIQS